MVSRVLRRAKSALRKIKPKYIKSGVVAATFILFAFFVISFFWPRTVNFSYDGANCFTNPVFFPSDDNSEQNDTISAYADPSLSLAGQPIYSHKTCFEPDTAPVSGASEKIHVRTNLWPFSQKTTVKVGEAPMPKLSGTSQFVSIRDPLTFSLDQADKTFTYRLDAGSENVVCANVDKRVLCNLEELKLTQSQTYGFKLTRIFSEQALDTVFDESLTTVEPVKITKSSVKSGGTVFNDPDKFVIQADKALVEASGVKLEQITDGKAAAVPINIEVEDSKLIISLSDKLKRRVNYRLSILDITAADRGFLTKPYIVNFNTSGGPRVIGSSIGSYGVSTVHNPVVSFNYALSDKQKLEDAVKLEINGRAVNADVDASGSSVIIIPKSALPRCTPFVIKINDSLKNKHGISGGNDWVFNSRTICQTSQSIGSSVLGRAITAYKFGSGSDRIVFVGGTHGDEASSTYTLNSLVDNLEANYGSIPKSRTVWVVPSINPDGLAAGTRVNARNVDLNRNFPANDWKKDVVMPGGSLLKNGGGKSPLSEPESSAIASFVLGQSPSLVLTYHAIGSLVIANESGNSMAMASLYGNLSSFLALSDSQSGGVFSHDTTGAFENWLHDKYGIPAILVELSGYGGNEFWSHSDAMWAMIKS